MTPAEVIALLKDSPEKCLRKCLIAIDGGSVRNSDRTGYALPPANGQAALATFKVTVKTGGNHVVRGFTTGLRGKCGVEKNRDYVKIEKLSGPAKLLSKLESDEVNAYHIPMVQTSHVAVKSSHYTLPTTIMGTLMFTTQLSGCSFGIGSNSIGATLVSHIQPNENLGGMDDVALRQDDVAQTIAKGFHTMSERIGLEHGYSQYATVIGQQAYRKWKFYVQSAEKRSIGRDTTNIITGVQVVPAW